ncbi:hypothetical protein HGA64_00900 [Candidatus Falkowbacteria bacterium]|nr:hypothetical protein [Candidatus Falkowbacteria bacterium]
MKNTFGNPKIIDFAAKKLEAENARDEASIERINARLSELRHGMKKYAEWAQEARKLGDEESAKHYETEAAEINDLIIKGEELLVEGHLRSIQRLEDEILRLNKELADGEKEFRLEQIEDDIARLQFDIDFLEGDDEMAPEEKKLKIDEIKDRITALENEKRELE